MKRAIVLTQQGWWIEQRRPGLRCWRGPYRWRWQAALRGWFP